VGNCLAALSYLNGMEGRTFRIAGQVQGVRRPFTAILSRNYAYIREGRWVDVKIMKNGHDWDRSLLSAPVSFWNGKDGAWSVGGGGMLPRLADLPWQEEVAVP
jgi:hypothetical protein